ncbi:hypothetical protein COLO4_03622 [Corchorus olitorius]|uniref:Non-haem dioxygenase N-terminal domain-containing protein n=1 Tax=Corchorus olitorius TaxID=93759 RepID=A0A1R3KXS9_9ROSI|nr:hypothetical protein COLO4_03622 [Corchorus olitorius]
MILQFPEYDQCWGSFFLADNKSWDRKGGLASDEDRLAAFLELPIEEKMKYAMAANDIQGFGQAYVVSEEQKLDWNDMIYLATLPAENRKFKFCPLTCPGFK